MSHATAAWNCSPRPTGHHHHRRHRRRRHHHHRRHRHHHHHHNSNNTSSSSSSTKRHEHVFVFKHGGANAALHTEADIDISTRRSASENGLGVDGNMSLWTFQLQLFLSHNSGSGLEGTMA